MVTDAKPVALIVENDRSSLDHRRLLFELEGFVTLGAVDYEEAMREIRGASRIDIVVTDINLHAARPSDVSGVMLARIIRDSLDRVPIVGYSAMFVEGDLLPEELRIFDSYVIKGSSTQDQISEHLRSWKKMAIEYRRSRAEANRLFSEINPSELSALTSRDEFVVRKYGSKYVETIFESKIAIMAQSFGLYVVQERHRESSVDIVCMSTDSRDKYLALVEAKTSTGSYSLQRRIIVHFGTMLTTFESISHLFLSWHLCS